MPDPAEDDMSAIGKIKVCKSDQLETTIKEPMPSQEALQMAAQAWCHEDTSGKVMDTVLATAFARILDRWLEEVKRHAGNEEFYRGLLNECGKHIGKEAYTADDGTVMLDPLCLKIPDLVAKLVKESHA